MDDQKRFRIERKGSNSIQRDERHANASVTNNGRRREKTKNRSKVKKFLIQSSGNDDREETVWPVLTGQSDRKRAKERISTHTYRMSNQMIQKNWKWSEGKNIEIWKWDTHTRTHSRQLQTTWVFWKNAQISRCQTVKTNKQVKQEMKWRSQASTEHRHRWAGQAAGKKTQERIGERRVGHVNGVGQKIWKTDIIHRSTVKGERKKLKERNQIAKSRPARNKLN